MKIGEIMPLDREITLNEGRKTVCIDVANTGDRPIQVGSHFHFFEVNKLLSFKRENRIADAKVRLYFEIANTSVIFYCLYFTFILKFAVYQCFLIVK